MKNYGESQQDILKTIQLLEEITNSKKMMYVDIGFIAFPLFFIL